MNAKDAYKKTIDSDLERIRAEISTTAEAGLQETLYRTSQPFKSEVLETLEAEGYVITKYAPTPMDCGDVYSRASQYKYVIGISWYNAK